MELEAFCPRCDGRGFYETVSPEGVRDAANCDCEAGQAMQAAEDYDATHRMCGCGQMVREGQLDDHAEGCNARDLEGELMAAAEEAARLIEVGYEQARQLRALQDLLPPVALWLNQHHDEGCQAWLGLSHPCTCSQVHLWQSDEMNMALDVALEARKS
jgi:hypothetical protein